MAAQGQCLIVPIPGSIPNRGPAGYWGQAGRPPGPRVSGSNAAFKLSLTHWQRASYRGRSND